MAFIGGVGHFYGPIIGAVLVTLLQSALSNYTQAWLLYFGLFFLVMILFAPGGIATLITLHKPAWQTRLRGTPVSAPMRWPPLPAAVLLLGFFALVEMIYHFEAKAEQVGKAFTLFGVDAAIACEGCPPGSAAAGSCSRSASHVFYWRRQRCVGGVRGTACTVATCSQGGGRLDGRAMPSNCTACTRASARTAIINGVDLAIEKGERHADHRAERRRQVDAVQPDQRPLPAHLRAASTCTARTSPASKPQDINRAACRAASRSPTSFRSCRCSRTSAAPCCGRSATSIPSGIGSARLKDVRERAEEIVEHDRPDQARATRWPACSPMPSSVRSRSASPSRGGANVILLDEPTAGMSHSETADAVELIRNVTDGKTLIMVEHDMSVVFGLADRISVLVYGEVIATGTPQEIRANKAVQEAYLGTEQH